MCLAEVKCIEPTSKGLDPILPFRCRGKADASLLFLGS